MKSLFSFVMGVFVLGFIFSADLAAEEEWEKKLMNEGWVKVFQKLMDNADTTWYGQEGSLPSQRSWIYYIDPTGKKVYFQFSKGGMTFTGKREVAKDGTHCIQFKGFFQGKNRCKRTLWKKGNLYQPVNEYGIPSGTIYAIKKGNLEKF